MLKKLKEKFLNKKAKSDAEQSTEYLGKENIKSLIFWQSLPAIIGQLVMALYNFVDRAFIGQKLGFDGLSALTIILPAYLIISSFGLALGIGASSIISRGLGEKKFEKVNQVFGTSQLIIILSSLLLVIISFFFQDQILTLFGASENNLGLCEDYFSIVLFGQVFGCFMFANTAIMRSIGDTKSVMIINIISALINVILDYVFIFIFDRGIKGAARATVISQIIAVGCILFYYVHGQKVITLSRKYCKIHKEYLKEIFLLGIPAFFRQIVGSIMMMLVNNFLGSYGEAELGEKGGDAAISACGIAQGLIVFFLTPIFGITQGIAPIIGYNYGAKLFQRVKDTLKTSFLRTTIFGIIISLIYLIHPTFLLDFFTSTEEEMAIAIIPTKLTMYTFFTIGIQIIIGTYYQCIGSYKKAFVLSLLRQVFVFIPCLFLLSHFWGLIGIYTTYPVSDGIAFILSLLIFSKDWKILGNHIKKQNTLQENKSEI